MALAMRFARTATGALLVLALVGLAAVVAGRAAHLSVAPVLSGSMRPAFAPGDLIVTRTVDVRNLRVGQVPVFVPPGQSAPYAHRIVSLKGDPAHPVLRTKGDANPTADAWVSRLATPTVPVVVGHLPYAGRLLAVGRTPHTRALVILLVGLCTTGLAVRLILTTPPPARPALP